MEFFREALMLLIFKNFSFTQADACTNTEFPGEYSYVQ